MSQIFASDFINLRSPAENTVTPYFPSFHCTTVTNTLQIFHITWFNYIYRWDLNGGGGSKTAGEGVFVVHVSSRPDQPRKIAADVDADDDDDGNDLTTFPQCYRISYTTYYITSLY